MWKGERARRTKRSLAPGFITLPVRDRDALALVSGSATSNSYRNRPSTRSARPSFRPKPRHPSGSEVGGPRVFSKVRSEREWSNLALLAIRRRSLSKFSVGTGMIGIFRRAHGSVDRESTSLMSSSSVSHATASPRKVSEVQLRHLTFFLGLSVDLMAARQPATQFPRASTRAPG